MIGVSVAQTGDPPVGAAYNSETEGRLGKAVPNREGEAMRFEQMRNRCSFSIEQRAAGQGFTLVELLVVIVLISTLVATAIPVLAPAGDERRLREASRNLNAYIQGAQARAIQTGRPFGIALRRLSEDTQNGADNAVVTRVEYIETPPEFAGFDSSSVARIVSVWLTDDPERLTGVPQRQLGLQLLRYADVAATQSNPFQTPTGYSLGLLPDAFLRPGDTIRIGSEEYVIMNLAEVSRGLWNQFNTLYGNDSPFAGYFQPNFGGQSRLIPIRPIADVDPNLRFTHYLDANTNTEVEFSALPPSAELAPDRDSYFATQPQSFKVFRQPVAAAAEPLEMPSSTAIDLQASIFGNNVRLYDPGLDYNESTDDFRVVTQPVTILFSPDGGIESVAGIQGFAEPTRVTSSLALLVGRRNLIPGDPTLAGVAESQAGYREPIDLREVAAAELTEIEQRELTDQFNWLNLESRWLVLGAQSGTTATIDTSSPILPAGGAPFGIQAQLGAALENAPGRRLAGGR